MDNYGEELGYWYLRLNGFFPITNFVLHTLSSDDIRERQYNADADLLAIRPPNVYEEIGGKPTRWDSKIVHHAEQSRWIFVYCEVKTGDYDVGKLFPSERIDYVKKRFGLTSVHRNGINIKKVLIANTKKRQCFR